MKPDEIERVGRIASSLVADVLAERDRVFTQVLRLLHENELLSAADLSTLFDRLERTQAITLGAPDRLATMRAALLPA